MFIAVNRDDVQANLLNLIQTMGSYLTHEDETIRLKSNLRFPCFFLRGLTSIT